MRIAITGASGQYGQLAVARLLERLPGSDLILISRNPQKLANFAARGADCRHGDFDDPPSLRVAFTGADRLLLISATRVGERVTQHSAAIEAAAASGVGQIVYTSFIGVDDRNPALIMRDHAATEDLLKVSGLDWTILRDAQYAEAVTEAIAPNALTSGQWQSSSGDGRMAFVARGDCVDSAVAVLIGEGHSGKTYNITGPDLLTYRDAAALIAEISGRPIEYVAVDDDGLYVMFDALGVPREPADSLTPGGIPWCSKDMVSFEAGVRGRWFEIISKDVESLTGRPPRSLRALLEERFGPNSQKRR